MGTIHGGVHLQRPRTSSQCFFLQDSRLPSQTVTESSFNINGAFAATILHNQSIIGESQNVSLCE
jgi:hypothetical protein